MPEPMPVPDVNHPVLPALVVVAAALVDAGGRVLMQQRPLARQHGGLWEFPGGKLEPGEGPVAALIRELSEELAITVGAADCVALGFAASEGAPGKRAVVLLLYGIRSWQGEPASPEGAALVWCRPARLSALAMPPLDVPLIGPAVRFAKARGWPGPAGAGP